MHDRSTQVLCSNRPASSRLRLCKPFSLTEARPKSSENGSRLKTLKITFSRVTLEEKSAFQNYVGTSHFQDERPESSYPCFGRFSGLHDFFYSRVTLETTLASAAAPDCTTILIDAAAGASRLQSPLVRAPFPHLRNLTIS